MRKALRLVGEGPIIKPKDWNPDLKYVSDIQPEDSIVYSSFEIKTNHGIDFFTAKDLKEAMKKAKTMYTKSTVIYKLREVDQDEINWWNAMKDVRNIEDDIEDENEESV